MMPNPLVRFSIGSMLGCLAVLSAFLVEYAVAHADTLYSVSIWWQIPQYVFFAAGELFVFSTSYEVAFTHAPHSLKSVASAIQLLVSATTSFISAGVFKLVSDWVVDFEPDDITSWHQPGGRADYDLFFLFLSALTLLGAVLSLCSLPFYRRMQASSPVEHFTA